MPLSEIIALFRSTINFVCWSNRFLHPYAHSLFGKWFVSATNERLINQCILFFFLIFFFREKKLVWIFQFIPILCTRVANDSIWFDGNDEFFVAWSMDIDSWIFRRNVDCLKFLISKYPAKSNGSTSFQTTAASIKWIQSENHK